MAKGNSEFFPWSDAFNVNIGIIDRQHRNLAALLNDLHQALAEEYVNAKPQTIFSILVKYARVHFETEELLMQSHEYRDYPAHKAEHERLIAGIAKLQAGFDPVAATGAADMLTCIKNWGISHMLSFDKSYAPFLNRQGVF
jgi:hemerythrin-like metal-binding protein